MKDWLLGLLMIALVGFSYWLCYSFGKWQERQAYTSAFEKEVEASYWEGYKDGLLRSQHETSQ